MRQEEKLADSLGYVLKQAATALHNAMESALRPESLTLSQYSCLEQLSREPEQSNAQLARAMFVTPQSMNDVLRGLQRRGLVERDEEATTGRARPSRLTASGRTVLDRARDLLAPVEAQLDAAVDDRSRALRDLTALSRAF